MASTTKHPYARNDFKGTAELQNERAVRVNRVYKSKLLLSNEELNTLIEKRKKSGLNSF